MYGSKLKILQSIPVSFLYVQMMVFRDVIQNNLYHIYDGEVDTTTCCEFVKITCRGDICWCR